VNVEFPSNGIMWVLTHPWSRGRGGRWVEPPTDFNADNGPARKQGSNHRAVEIEELVVRFAAMTEFDFSDDNPRKRGIDDESVGLTPTLLTR
jgi:hypothetical protein